MKRESLKVSDVEAKPWYGLVWLLLTSLPCNAPVIFWTLYFVHLGTIQLRIFWSHKRSPQAWWYFETSPSIIFLTDAVYINFYSAWRSCEVNKVIKFAKDLSFQSLLFFLYFCPSNSTFFIGLEQVLHAVQVFIPNRVQIASVVPLLRKLTLVPNILSWHFHTFHLSL